MSQQHNFQEDKMPQVRRVLLLALAGLLLVGCAGPRPAPVPTRPKAQATLPWVDTLPADGWFSIRATGRLGPFLNDLIVVYQDGRAIYNDQSVGQQYELKLDPNGIARWNRMFVDQAKFMSLKDTYPPDPSLPIEVEEEEKNSPKYNDAIRYTILYREGGIVKTVTANTSGAPRELVPILNAFWNFIESIKRGSVQE
jgi:hypothetical protein